MFLALFQFHVCYHDGVYCLCEWHGTPSTVYMLLFSFSVCGKDTCHKLHVTFSSPPAFGGYQCITKVLNRFQYFNGLAY